MMINPTQVWRLLTVIALLMVQTSGFCQVNGGRYAFSFLSLSPSARTTGLGGIQIAVRDDDPALVAQNPGALNPDMHDKISWQHHFFLKDIQHGYAAYTRHLQRPGLTMQAAVQFIQYGEIKQTDTQGNVTGSLKASESGVNVGLGKQLNPRLSIGLNFKATQSVLDIYRAYALASDVGLIYADTSRRWSAAVVVRNFGKQVQQYAYSVETLPFDVQVGLSKRLKYLPFRMSIIIHNLHRWNIVYDNPATQQSSDIFDDGMSTGSARNKNIDILARHLIFNGEFLLGKQEGFRLRLGYNHLRKMEMTVNNYRSLAGFTTGIGIRVSRFRIDVGYGAYHLAGGIIHFGIGTNLGQLF
jgi:hypothetical protein